MQVQVNTDNHIAGTEQLAHWVEAEVTSALERFSDHITRVEVHLSDVNSDKAGASDKRCVMEARVAGLQPIAVSHQGEALEQAIDGASEKLIRALEHTLGRLADRKGQPLSQDDQTG